MGNILSFTGFAYMCLERSIYPYALLTFTLEFIGKLMHL